MGEPIIEKLPLNKAILEAMDGRRNKWLAEKTDIDAGQISRIINGLKPTQDQLDKINIALSTDFILPE